MAKPKKLYRISIEEVVPGESGYLTPATEGFKFEMTSEGTGICFLLQPILNKIDPVNFVSVE